MSFLTRFLAIVLAVGFLMTPTKPLKAYELRPIVIELRPSGSGSSATMIITNSHSVPIAIEISAFRREQNADGSDTLTLEEDDLIVGPPQMIIAAGASQSFKVQWIGDPSPQRELTYRIVTEQLPIDLAKGANGTGVNGEVKVQYRYEAALYVIPPGAEPSARLASVERVMSEDGTEMLEVGISSEGTMRAILDKPVLELRAADGSMVSLTGKSLVELNGLNILAGNMRKIRLPVPEGLGSGAVSGTLTTEYFVLS